jgi:hypothetical protein
MATQGLSRNGTPIVRNIGGIPATAMSGIDLSGGASMRSIRAALHREIK